MNPTVIIDKLNTLYGEVRWEHPTEPMDTLISCILSQNTSDANSFPAFERLKKHFATWKDLADADESVICELIRSAGFANQKTKRIKEVLAKISIECGEYSIDFLRNYPLDSARKWLMNLPGIGPKCAAIILCFSFGMPEIPVDTHVFRVSWRLGLIDRKIGEAKAHVILRELVPENLAYQYHVYLIRHGREVCKAIKPLCIDCVINDHCRYHASSFKHDSTT